MPILILTIPDVLSVLLMILLVTAAAHVGGHGHSHSEDGVKPSFKYSREANFVEDDIMEDDIVDLPPQYSNEKPGKNQPPW